MPTYVFDDFYGDQRPGSNSPGAVYSPETGQWDPVHGSCSQCVKTNIPVPIKLAQVMNGTWHSATVNPGEAATSITITFTGTSVTVYCMLPPNLDAESWTSQMNMTFQLDGVTVGSYKRQATTSDWTYNAAVFSQDGLENTEHTFVISPQGQDGDTSLSDLVNSSYIAFDYITYEYEDPTPPSTTATTSAPPTPVPTASTDPPAPATTSQTTAAGPSSSSQSTAITVTTGITESAQLLPGVLSVSQSSTILSNTTGKTESSTSSISSGEGTSSSSPNGSGASVTSGSLGAAIPTGLPISTDKTTSSRSSKTAIIGGAVGGAIALLLVLFLLWRALRKRGVRRANVVATEPFTSYRPEPRELRSEMLAATRSTPRRPSTMSSTVKEERSNPLTPDELEAHEQSQDGYRADLNSSDATVVRSDAQSKAFIPPGEEEPEEATTRAEIEGPEGAEIQILRLRSEAEILRAERDGLRLVLREQDESRGESRSPLLPSYQDVVQSRRDDTVLAFS